MALIFSSRRYYLFYTQSQQRTQCQEGIKLFAENPSSYTKNCDLRYYWDHVVCHQGKSFLEFF